MFVKNVFCLYFLFIFCIGVKTIMRFILNKRWYFFLKPKSNTEKSDDFSKKRALFSDFPRNTLGNKLIVQLTDPEDFRLFSVFESHVDFYKYCLKFLPVSRCFYETILGEFSQKPHFDIDISLEENSEVDDWKVMENLISCILEVLIDFSINIELSRQMLIFSSHGPKKKSYHLIIDGFYHSNYQEARSFYDLVVAKMNPEYASFVDSAVYSSLQQFRMVGSQKRNSNRPKVFHLSWTFCNQKIEYIHEEPPENEDHQNIMELLASLISITFGCEKLPSFGVISQNDISTSGTTTVSSKGNKNVQYLTISKKTAIAAINLLATHANMDRMSQSFPYIFDGINGGLVLLKRVKASMCRICCRRHKNENPYLITVENENIIQVYFHCRRAPVDKKWYLGDIDGSSVYKNKKEDETIEMARENENISEFLNDENLSKELPVLNTHLMVKPQDIFFEEMSSVNSIEETEKLSYQNLSKFKSGKTPGRKKFDEITRDDILALNKLMILPRRKKESHSKHRRKLIKT